jgi:transcription antitermination factor NusG
MTLWVIATTTGQEQLVQEQLDALALSCAVPLRVDMRRQGKRRRPDPVVSAYLPGYAFAWFGDDDWHAVREAKHVRSMMGVTAAAERGVQAFIDRVEADYRDRMAQIEAGQRVCEYEPGDLLQIMGGQFLDRLARFRRMVDEPGEAFPQIEAETEMMGRTVRVRLDPIAVRKAAS